MTRYDDLKLNTGATTPDNNDDEDDMNAMNDLELELASQTGRLTGLSKDSQLQMEGKKHQT